MTLNRTFAAITMLAVAVGLVTAAPASHASTADPLEVALIGTYDGPGRVGLVAGAVASTWSASGANLDPSDTLPFTFSVTCSDATPCPGELTVRWDLGDSTILDTDATTITHSYNLPGVYTVTARVLEADLATPTRPDAHGKASIRVVVSPRWADVDTPEALATPPAALRDTSGNGYDATPTGTTLTSRSTTSALHFDDVDDHIALPVSYSGADTVPTVTVEAWIRTSHTGNPNPIVDFDENAFFNLYLQGDGRVAFDSTSATGGHDDLSTAGSVNDGTWHHLAAVYDGTDKIIYIDGAEAGRRVNAHGGEPIGTATTRYGFLGDGSSTTTFDGTRTGLYYNGDLSHVRIWDVARTSSQVASSRTALMTGPQTGLVASWPLDDVSFDQTTGRGDREAIWIAGTVALNTCRAGLPSLNPGIDPSSTAVDRGMFCPEPSTDYYPAAGTIAMPEPTAPATTPDSAYSGITGISCLASWSTCGLPARIFAQGGDPTQACGAACRTQLLTAGYIDTADRLTYDPTNCLDGWVPVRDAGSWSVQVGSEHGCVTRGEFFSTLVRLIDGGGGAGAGQLLTPSSACSDGVAGLGADAILRADALGISALRTRGAVQYCDTLAAVTKAEAYVAVAETTGLTPSCPATLRDLNDQTLGNGALTPHPDCADIGALLSVDGPLVGSSRCVDDVGVCFNPGEALTRSQLAVILHSLIASFDEPVAAVHVDAQVATNPQNVHTPVPLTVTMLAPSYYATTDTVTLTWPTTAAGVSSIDCPSPQVFPVGPTRKVTAKCNYTRETAGEVALTFDVTGSGGGSTSTTVPITIVNDAPRVDQTATIAEHLENATSLATTYSGFDPEGQALTWELRSFTTDGTDPVSYPLTGNSSTTVWGATANTEVGVASITASDATSATLQVTPHDDDVYGAYSFALRACDQDTCTERQITSEVEAVNDPAVLPALVTVSNSTSVLEQYLELGGDDPKDIGRENFTTGGALCGGDPAVNPSCIQYWEIRSLPSAGTLYYDTACDGNTVWAVAVVGAQACNPLVRYVPPAVAGSYTFTYRLRDGGYPLDGANQGILSGDATAEFNVTP